MKEHQQVKKLTIFKIFKIMTLTMCFSWITMITSLIRVYNFHFLILIWLLLSRICAVMSCMPELKSHFSVSLYFSGPSGSMRLSVLRIEYRLYRCCVLHFSLSFINRVCRCHLIIMLLMLSREFYLLSESLWRQMFGLLPYLQ